MYVSKKAKFKLSMAKMQADCPTELQTVQILIHTSLEQKNYKNYAQINLA